MFIYLLLSGVFFLFMGIIWNPTNFVNVMIKVFCISMVGAAFALILTVVAPEGVTLANGIKIY